MLNDTSSSVMSTKNNPDHLLIKYGNIRSVRISLKILLNSFERIILIIQPISTLDPQIVCGFIVINRHKSVI